MTARLFPLLCRTTIQPGPDSTSICGLFSPGVVCTIVAELLAESDCESTLTVLARVGSVMATRLKMRGMMRGFMRGRLGYLIAPTLLGYGSAGFAQGETRASTFMRQNWTNVGWNGPLLQTSGATGGYSGFRTGWTIGGGLKWKFTPAMSLKAEYPHYDLGRLQYDSGAIATSFLATFTNMTRLTGTTRLSSEMARLGVNDHFSPAQAAPIFAE